jgi:hypothetical protein
METKGLVEDDDPGLQVLVPQFPCFRHNRTSHPLLQLHETFVITVTISRIMALCATGVHNLPFVPQTSLFLESGGLSKSHSRNVFVSIFETPVGLGIGNTSHKI